MYQIDQYIKIAAAKVFFNFVSHALALRLFMLRRCVTRSQCVSLSPLGAPLKPSP